MTNQISISPSEHVAQVKKILRKIPRYHLQNFIESCGSIRIFDVRTALIEILEEGTGVKYYPPKNKPYEKFKSDGDMRRFL